MMKLETEFNHSREGTLILFETNKIHLIFWRRLLIKNLSRQKFALAYNCTQNTSAMLNSFRHNLKKAAI